MKSDFRNDPISLFHLIPDSQLLPIFSPGYLTFFFFSQNQTNFRFQISIFVFPKTNFNPFMPDFFHHIKIFSFFFPSKMLIILSFFVSPVLWTCFYSDVFICLFFRDEKQVWPRRRPHGSRKPAGSPSSIQRRFPWFPGVQSFWLRIL